MVAGVFTLNVGVTGLGAPYGNLERLLAHLAVGCVCLTLLVLAAYGRLLPAWRTADGLPVTFFVLLVVCHTWAGSAVLVDFASTADLEFLLMNTVVLLAGAVGLIMTAAPFALPTRLAFAAMLLPSFIVTAVRGRWVEAVAVLVFLGFIVGRVVPDANATFRELFELRQQAAGIAMRERLRALTDELTSLPNRRGTMEQYLNNTSAFGWVLYLDLDRFKEVNDTGGHAAGDRVLAVVAERLTASVPSGGVVGRMGGDEFVVLLPAEVEGVAEVIGAIGQGLTAPIAAGDRLWNVGVSIGRAPLSPDRSFEQALLEADEKMFLRKAARRLEQRYTADPADPVVDARA